MPRCLCRAIRALGSYLTERDMMSEWSDCCGHRIDFDVLTKQMERKIDWNRARAHRRTGADGGESVLVDVFGYYERGVQQIWYYPGFHMLVVRGVLMRIIPIHNTHPASQIGTCFFREFVSAPGQWVHRLRLHSSSVCMHYHFDLSYPDAAGRSIRTRNSKQQYRSWPYWITPWCWRGQPILLMPLLHRIQRAVRRFVERRRSRERARVVLECLSSKIPIDVLDNYIFPRLP
jgi:hypothetical protein